MAHTGWEAWIASVNCAPLLLPPPHASRRRLPAAPSAPTHGAQSTPTRGPRDAAPPQRRGVRGGGPQAGQRPPRPASCPAAVHRGRLPSGAGQRPNPAAPKPDPAAPLPDLVGVLLSRPPSPGSRPSSPVCSRWQPVTFWCSVGLPYRQCSVGFLAAPLPLWCTAASAPF